MDRPLLFLVLSAVFALCSWSVREPDAEVRLKEEAAGLQERLHDHAERATGLTRALASDLAQNGATSWMKRHTSTLESERQLTGTVLLGFVRDSLVCWSGSLPAEATAVLNDTAAQLTTPDAIYLHMVVTLDSLHLHALSPVWLTPAIENRYIERRFHASLAAAEELSAQPAQASGPLITDAAGAPLLRLAWRGDAVETGPWIILRLLLLVLSTACLIVSAWSLSERSALVRSPWMRIGLFTAFLSGLRWCVLLFIPSAPFDRLPLFDPATYAASFAFPSLGDLVINAALLVVAVVFARRQLDGLRTRTPHILWIPIIWTCLLGSAAWITTTMIGLVNDSSVDLDLYHVQNLNGSSAAAVLGMALLFIAWSLLAEISVEAFARYRPVRTPWIIGGIAFVASIVLHQGYGVLDTVLFLWPLPLLLLLVHIGYDRPRFVHVILGIGVLAALTAHVLSKYTRDREHRERLVLAERLSLKEDPVVELLFREVAPALRTDVTIHQLITSGKPCAAGELDAAVRQLFFGGFWERYDVRVFALDANGQVRCASDGSAPRSLEQRTSAFTDHTPLADMPDLFFEQGGQEGAFYHARLAVMPNEGAQPGQLIIELHPRSAAQAMGLPELLLAGEEPLIRRTERYAIARYERGVLVDRTHTQGVPLLWTREIAADGTLWYIDQGMEMLARGVRGGTVITLGLPVPGMLDKATTFSYLFALFSLLLAVAMLARSLVRHRGLPPMGLGAKVRAALLSFAVIGLVLFAGGANLLLNKQYSERSQAAILEKARSAHAELQQRFDGQPPITKDRTRYLEHLLADLSNVLFSDITVYDLHGRSLASSRPQAFTNGLLGPRMDPVAYTRMVVEGASDFVHEESIGTANYQCAYLPLRDHNGTVLAYLALPAFADQRQQEQERSGVLVAVVNLFVLLFALSVLVALFISNWTTRPLDLLKRSLSAVDLQRKNEPLPYHGRDEVGQLVEVYNQKVDELRRSAEKLARSERESAWKEMARQVAHEIKNPLTPMKLGLQHFQHTWDPNAPDAKAKLDRFTSSMVEQIDVLSRVAGDFSRFAQLSAAKETILSVNEVARSVVALFAGEEAATVSLNEAPELRVKADREHLVRVLNNLIKNALQAIPDGRPGRVDVVLEQRGNNAVIEVRDNGSGIALADRERIFTPSFTTKSSGTGLGLAMVKRMVEQAGGMVWFGTREEEGTSFFVSLPLHP